MKKKVMLVYVRGVREPYVVEGAFRIGYVCERIKRGCWIYVKPQEGVMEEQIPSRSVSRIVKLYR